MVDHLLVRLLSEAFHRSCRCHQSIPSLIYSYFNSADWTPQVPWCRTVVNGDILLYHYPTFLESTQPALQRNILINWGTLKANKVERKVIWPTGNCIAYHTFVRIGKPDEPGVRKDSAQL